MATTPWARSRGLVGDEAMYAYQRERIALEDRLRPRLDVAWIDLPTAPGGRGTTWAQFEGQLVAVVDRLTPP